LKRAILLLLCACRPRAIPVDAAPIDPQTTITATATDEVLYVDLGGRIRRAVGVASVPALSRHVVAVEGPDGPGGAVWIADVSQPAPSWIGARSTMLELERRGLVALPPGAASHEVFPSVDPTGAAPPADGIVVYGASWCGACADTRAWLDERQIPYAFRNIEVDVEAAADAVALCASLDVVADRIPVIDLAGRVVVGFDPTRLATILGASI
jgi:hypothetical protein